MASTIPPGWSTSSDVLQVDYYWDEGGPGAAIKAEKGFKLVRPVMGTEPQTGTSVYMFEADTKFNLWNLIEDTVYETTGPKTESEVIQTIGKDNVAGLQVEQV